MPEGKSAEGKSAEESKEGKASDGGSLLAALTAFATTEQFSEACDEWYEEHSEGFEGADVAKEQRLEWTSVYEDYLNHLETELLTGFYAENDTTEEKVFEELSQRRESDPNWGFVPAFLQNIEYSTFIANMHGHATEKLRVKRALDKRASLAEIDPTMRALVEVQGVYRCDVKGTDWAQYKKFYRACGVPKMFCGAFVWTGKKSKSIFAPYRDKATGDLGLSISIKFLFFGANEWKLALGQSQEYKVPAIGPCLRLSTLALVLVQLCRSRDGRRVGLTP